MIEKRIIKTWKKRDKKENMKKVKRKRNKKGTVVSKALE